MGTSYKLKGRNPKKGITGETQVLWQEDALWAMNSQVQGLML